MISLSLDITDAQKALQRIPKQFHFAGVVALTKTAKHGQAGVKSKLTKEFNLKNTWTERGVRIKPAQKTEREPFAEVFHMDPHIAQHEAGAVRNLNRKRVFVKIAVREVFGIPETKVVPKSLRAESLLKKKSVRGIKPFYGRSKSGKPGVFGRFNGVKRMLYLEHLPKTINIPKNEWFFEPIEQAYDKHFIPEYNDAIERYVTG